MMSPLALAYLSLIGFLSLERHHHRGRALTNAETAGGKDHLQTLDMR